MAILQASVSHVWCILLFYLYMEVYGARIPTEEIVVPPNVCTSQECINAAKTIYEYRNISVRPCDNFFEFVCGGYRASHPVGEDKIETNTYWDLTELNAERTRDILESEPYPAEPEFAKKVKNFYQSCLNRDKHASQNLQILLERLDDWGGWPIATKKWVQDKFDWLKLLLHLIKTADMTPLFWVEVYRDNRNSSQRRLMIDQANDEDVQCSDHGSRISEEKLTKSIVDLALRIVNETNQSTSEEETEENEEQEERIQKEAERITRFKTLLCKIRKIDKLRLYDISRFHVKTVKQLQNLTDNVLPINTYAKIEWLQLFNDFLQESSLKIDENEEVLMADPEFFSKLVELIDNTPPRTLANYMLWQQIQWMEGEEWLKCLEDDSSDEEDCTKTDTEEERWRSCVAQTNENFLHAIGYLYVKMYSKQVLKQRVESFTQNIHKSFLEDLRLNEWMDNKTRTAAVEKARHMKYLVGYPDWYNTSQLNKKYRKYPLDENYITNMEYINKIKYQDDLDFFDGTEKEQDLWVSISEAQACNFYQLSSIEISAANFQAPLYVHGRPAALNYGALGSAIGHEITHSFDDVGRKYDGLGNLRNWWTNDSLRKFKAKTKCIEEMYSGYPTPELEEEKAWRLDGPGTVSENIADIGGLEIALSAYRKYLRQNGPEKKLPGLTKYTSEQLFFIGFGLQFCESTTPEWEAVRIVADEHTPEMYRNLITVSNSKDFSDVWKCKEEDEMNAPTKCPFW